jgi:hypothetical protein
MERAFDLRLLFLVLAGGGTEHLRDEAAQRETWAGDDSDRHSVIWLRAGARNQFDHESRTLYVPSNESELLKKTVLAVDWALENMEFDAIVRTNVSSFFVIDTLIGKLHMRHFNSNSFGGHLHYKKSPRTDSTGNFFISGTGIFLGKNAAWLLSKIPLKEYESIPDDIAITEYLNKFLDLNIISIPRLSLSNHHFFFTSCFIRCKSSWNDSLASERMRLLNSYFSVEGRLEKILFALRIYCFEIKNCRFSLFAPLRYLNRIRVEIKDFELNRKLSNPNSL